MAEPWIRVHAGLIDKPIIDRAVVALDISEHEAIGLLVTFWGGVSQNIIGGHVADVSDRQIERWARWHGRRGRFANFIRTAHLDADGRVNEWDEYAGALEVRREKERERLRNKRHPVAQQPRNTAPGVAQHRHETVNGVAPLLQPARADETKRDETRTTTASSSARGNSADDDSRAQLADLSGPASAALDSIASRASNRMACLTALSSMATGNDPATTKPTLPVLELALVDYAANGERWNAALFRAYLERATRAADNSPNATGPPSKNGGKAARDFGGARNDAAIDSTLDYLEAKYGK